MKSILAVGLILCLAIFSTSCKEEKEPRLTVTVLDTTGVRLPNMKVITDPCYFDSSTCDRSRLNPVFMKQQFTGTGGFTTFNFPYSAVLDVVAFMPIVDTVGGTADTVDWWLGSTVVSIETKELKSDEKNEFNTTVQIDRPLR